MNHLSLNYLADSRTYNELVQRVLDQPDAELTSATVQTTCAVMQNILDNFWEFDKADIKALNTLESFFSEMERFADKEFYPKALNITQRKLHNTVEKIKSTLKNLKFLERCLEYRELEFSLQGKLEYLAASEDLYEFICRTATIPYEESMPSFGQQKKKIVKINSNMVKNACQFMMLLLKDPNKLNKSVSSELQKIASLLKRSTGPSAPRKQAVELMPVVERINEVLKVLESKLRDFEGVPPLIFKEIVSFLPDSVIDRLMQDEIFKKDLQDDAFKDLPSLEDKETEKKISEMSFNEINKLADNQIKALTRNPDNPRIFQRFHEFFTYASRDQQLAMFFRLRFNCSRDFKLENLVKSFLLDSLAQMTNLTRLYPDEFASWSPEGIQLLANKNLQELSLMLDPSTAEQSLAILASMDSLNYLGFVQNEDDTAINEKSIRLFINNIKTQNLTELRFSNCTEFNENCLRMLAIHLPYLETIRLYNTGVSEKRAQEILQELSSLITIELPY